MQKNEYVEMFTPCIYFLTYFSSEYTPNYAGVKTENFYGVTQKNGNF